MDSYNGLNSEIMESLQGRYLLFNVEDRLYGVSLELVLEIIQVQTISKLPNVADYVKGLTNLRGKVIPVVDVRLKMNLPEKAYDDKTCIVVLDIRGTHIGLVVDSVADVTTIDTSKLSSLPLSGNTHQQILSSIIEMGDRVVINIDFERFFQDDISSLRGN